MLPAGSAAGEFRKVNVDATVACLLGTVESFVRAKTHLGMQCDLEEITDCIAELYTDGLRARQG